MTFEEFKDLVKFCRENNVIKASYGGVEIELVPEFPEAEIDSEYLDEDLIKWSTN